MNIDAFKIKEALLIIEDVDPDDLPKWFKEEYYDIHTRLNELCDKFEEEGLI